MLRDMTVDQQGKQPVSSIMSTEGKPLIMQPAVLIVPARSVAFYEAVDYRSTVLMMVCCRALQACTV